MDVTARSATTGDIPELVRLYRLLEAEMIPLEEIWPLAAGLAEPADQAFADALAATDTTVLIGSLDRVPFGLLLGRREALSPQAGRALIGSIRYVFTQQEAREVGVAEAMISTYLAGERAAGIRLFDAHVTPGHRLAKNFFETQGFSARNIVMHRADRKDD